MGRIYIETPHLEVTYRELADLGEKLRVPIPERFLEIKVMTLSQTEPLHWHKQRSHSWNRVTLQSNNAADNGKAVDYDYLLEAM